jgi:LPS export ABC transporter protein LptC
MDLKNFDFKKINWQIFKRKKTIYILLLAVLVGVLAWAFIAAGVITRNFNRQQLVGTENKQKLDISGIILTETKDDKKYWEIYGEKGQYSSDNKIALLENVTGNFYSNNAVSMSFKSSNGTYNTEKKEIILYKHTLIVIKDGTALYCDRLTWTGSNKPIIAQGNIKIVRNKSLVSTAQTAVISPDYDDFKIIGKTVTKLYDLKEKK